MKRFPAKKPVSPSADLRDLAECVEKFSGKTIVLLGDFVADEFRYGEISRVSREAPVLILRHRETHLVPGGGANAANNLVSLGARVLPITVVGDDAAGNALVHHFRRKGVNTSGLLCLKGWTTRTKSRCVTIPVLIALSTAESATSGRNGSIRSRARAGLPNRGW